MNDFNFNVTLMKHVYIFGHTVISVYLVHALSVWSILKVLLLSFVGPSVIL